MAPPATMKTSTASRSEVRCFMGPGSLLGPFIEGSEVYTYAVNLDTYRVGVSLYSLGEYVQWHGGKYKADFEDDPLAEEDFSTDPHQFVCGVYLQPEEGWSELPRDLLEMSKEVAELWLTMDRERRWGYQFWGLRKLGLAPGDFWADEDAELTLLRRFPEGSPIQSRGKINELEGRVVDDSYRYAATEEALRQEVEIWD